MTEAEREFVLWGAFLLLVFLAACAVADLADRPRPVTPVVEHVPPPSMVTQMLQEAQDITRQAASGADADDAQ